MKVDDNTLRYTKRVTYSLSCNITVIASQYPAHLESNAPLLSLDLIGSVRIILSKTLLSVPQTCMQMREELNPLFPDQEQQ